MRGRCPNAPASILLGVGYPTCHDTRHPKKGTDPPTKTSSSSLMGFQQNKPWTKLTKSPPASFFFSSRWSNEKRLWFRNMTYHKTALTTMTNESELLSPTPQGRYESLVNTQSSDDDKHERIDTYYRNTGGAPSGSMPGPLESNSHRYLVFASASSDDHTPTIGISIPCLCDEASSSHALFTAVRKNPEPVSDESSSMDETETEDLRKRMPSTPTY